MPMFAMYRVNLERIVLFMKIVNQLFERKECFRQHQPQSVDGGSERIKGVKTFTCQLFIQSILQATQASSYLT